MSRARPLVALLAALALGVGAAPPAPPGPPRPYTADQERALAIRAAQADGLSRLTAMVLGARVSAVKTLGQALGPAGDAEIALRVFLRSARMAAEPRLYSDGVAEVDVEVPLEAVVRKVGELHTPGEHETVALDDLRPQAPDGSLRVTGRGRAPPSVAPGVLDAVQRARPEDLPDLFPLGWERVTATGRVEAAREARVRAHRAMDVRLRGILLGQTETIGDLVGGSSASEAMFDAFVRSLPVAQPTRFMPDLIAEVDVTAAVRDLIHLLKDIRALRTAEVRWTDDRIDRLSVRLKAENLTATGRGMPPAAEIRPADVPPVAAGSPLPDWAAQVLEAAAGARFSDDVQDRQEARVLAARSAKARAATDLENQVDAVILEEGVTVRQRAAKDDVFRRDLKTFLSGARTVVSRAAEDGKGWEVVLQLPLIRLYEVSRSPR